MNVFVIVVLIISSLGLIVSVLLQPGKSAGLSGSIAGASEQFFGKTAAKGMEGKLSILSKIFAVIFLVSSLGLTMLLK